MSMVPYPPFSPTADDESRVGRNRQTTFLGRVVHQLKVRFRRWSEKAAGVTKVENGGLMQRLDGVLIFIRAPEGSPYVDGQEVPRDYIPFFEIEGHEAVNSLPPAA